MADDQRSGAQALHGLVTFLQAHAGEDLQLEVKPGEARELLDRALKGDPPLLRYFLAAEVLQERERQDQKWGGPAHDDQHHPDTWADMIASRALGAALADTTADYRRRLVQAAALAMAAIEAHDRQAAQKAPG